MNEDELKAWRKRTGLSQSTLAALLLVDVTTVSRWERGVREIPPFLPLALETIERNLDIKDRKTERPIKSSAKRSRKKR